MKKWWLVLIVLVAIPSIIGLPVWNNDWKDDGSVDIDNFESDKNLTVNVTWTGFNSTMKYVYNWELNDEPITLINMPFEKINGTSSNNAWDYSGKGNNASEQGGIVWCSNCGYDGKGTYRFNRVSSNWMSVDWNQGLNLSGKNFTITAWVYINSSVDTNIESIFGTGFGGTNGVILGYRRSGYGFILQFYDNPQGHPSMLADTDHNTGSYDTWTFVSATYRTDLNQSNICYSDSGSLTCTGWEMRAGAVFGPTNGQNVEIGTRLGNHYMNGTIDELIVWNISLSDNQIYALYTNQTNTIVSDETRTGEVWKVCVTPNDQNEDGTQKCDQVFLDQTFKFSSYEQGMEYFLINWTAINESALNTSSCFDEIQCQISIDNLTWTNITSVRYSGCIDPNGLASVELLNPQTTYYVRCKNGSTIFNYMVITTDIGGEGIMDNLSIITGLGGLAVLLILLGFYLILMKKNKDKDD